MALVDRSISAGDAIGETASKIGIGVQALQELRFAASLAGVEQQTLDMALQRFVRRVAEAASGTGDAKDALAQMGIALRDQSRNLRRSRPPRRESARRIGDGRQRRAAGPARRQARAPGEQRVSRQRDRRSVTYRLESGSRLTRSGVWADPVGVRGVTVKPRGPG